MFEAVLIITNVVLFGLLMALVLGSSPRVHQDGWLHSGTWQQVERGRAGSAYTWHLDGMPYDQAPRPPRRHKCRAQTCRITSTLHHEDRCACGAARVGVYGQWLGRNMRWDSSS